MCEVFKDIFSDWKSIVTGYGSEQGLSALSLDCDFYERACQIYEYIRDNFSDQHLVILGIYRSVNDDGTPELDEKLKQVLRVISLDGSRGRRVVPGDFEHGACCWYQMLAWTMANRRANLAQPAQPHGLPFVKRDLLQIYPEVSACALKCIEAFKQMVRDGTWPALSDDFQLVNEEAVRDILNAVQAELMSPVPAEDEQRDESSESGSEEEVVEEDDGRRHKRRQRVFACV